MSCELVIGELRARHGELRARHGELRCSVVQTLQVVWGVSKSLGIMGDLTLVLEIERQHIM